MEADIPIWLSGQQIIMKGVDSKTTCGEVIAALVGKGSETWTMVERWKGVERQLAHKARILKVWNQWANEKDQVKLAIRRQTERRPRRGKPDRNNIERLLKLILAQGETIQNRLQFLVHSDSDRNLPKDSSSTSCPLETPHLEDSTTTNIPTDSKDLTQLIEFYEKISKINKKLEKQEGLLVKMHIQIERHTKKDIVAILSKLKQMKIQNDNWYKEWESNASTLSKADTYIRDKTEFLQYLYKELHQSGLETARLMEIKDKMNTNPKDKDISSDGDTNSDTGLSSLHSSSEEGTYIIGSAL